MASGDQRFSGRSRLRSSSDYRRVFDEAKRSTAGPLTILARVRPGQPARLGLVVSRKVARTAIARNRLKRLIRESFRAHRQDIAGFDLVAVARPSLTSRSNEEIRRLLARHWETVRKWKE